MSTDPSHIVELRADDLQRETASSVVVVKEVAPHVIQVVMCDREHKNMFSTALVKGLVDAFTQIAEHPHHKVVILTGYDCYFLSGGDHAGLLALQEARARFTDNRLYRLLLDCPLPVISAMQGHGIGGGFAFGLFADSVILSRESVYTANFMNFGFTPGMGATCILPRKLGPVLAAEMLLSARTYRGGELEKRGVGIPVLKRQEVLPFALELASDIAQKPRKSLILLKDNLTKDLRSALPSFIEEELAMHEVTFHAQEVRDRISRTFAPPDQQS
jgi:polyketide biosynthesis enoyl-CoA hydratase PksI